MCLTYVFEDYLKHGFVKTTVICHRLILGIASAKQELVYWVVVHLLQSLYNNNFLCHRLLYSGYQVIDEVYYFCPFKRQCKKKKLKEAT